MNTWAQKDAVTAEVKKYAKTRMKEKQAQDLCRFIDVFFGPSAPEDVLNVEIPTLYHLAKSMWDLAAVRKPGAVNFRVFNPDLKKDGWQTPHTVIQIVNDDMPFIVDSITGGLSATHHLGIHVVHHPVFVVERNAAGKRLSTVGTVDFDEGSSPDSPPESSLYIEIDAQSDPKKLKSIEKIVIGILSDVRMAVVDWRGMMAKIDETVAALTARPSAADFSLNDEAIALLRWLAADHFTFLGYREYRFDGNPKTARFDSIGGSGLGILRDPKRFVLRGAEGLTPISQEIRHFLLQDDPVIITKANVKSTVHRPVHMDYVGVKMFDSSGKVVGEHRFVGLFTSLAYSRNAKDIPLLRRKVVNVQRRAVFHKKSHAGKALAHILETFPRDELFQINEDQLLEISLGVLHLMERPQTKVFVRQDKFERFASVLVYVPREKYHSDLRGAIEKLLCKAFNGEISVYYAQLSNDVMARWQFIVRTKPGSVRHPDVERLNRNVQEVAKGWAEHLHDELVERLGEERGNQLFDAYRDVFSIAYREEFAPRQAIIDIEKLEEVGGADDVRFDLYRRRTDPENAVRLKINHGRRVVPLSECLPMLEHLGLKVIGEHAYELERESGGCVHDFYLTSRFGERLDGAVLKPLIEDLLNQVWHGLVEDDGFNALTTMAYFTWQDGVILRAYAKYLRQIGLAFSQDYVEDCLVEYSAIAALFLKLFKLKFEPKGPSAKAREEEAKAFAQEIRRKFTMVNSLDQDRILRSYLNVIMATIRTNFYQDEYISSESGPSPQLGLALKIRSAKVREMPKPKPYAEIFVYSPRLEGIHLRFGPVARGGLRWSDRREDFRTEVLGLVKAQQVKNVVIVPVGAKGGFIPKHLPHASDREGVLTEGTACYKIFIRSLLSVTDNLIAGKAVPPKKTVRYDGKDPYLVVAADKGTASFSDIANGIAQSRNFWLDDAFASGGSKGYDHKKMAITARGAWVSVQRHFREMGIDVQKDPITVIGIGDMSGDVFGNGMLLSKTIRLQAAFDHRHIFFDPDPDPEKSYKERKRLFALPRSSWADYNSKLISKGGGVFNRSAKSIPLTNELKVFLGTDQKSLSPQDLIHAILKAKADLLWVGGIGTYVKASYESHGEAGDRSNDALRVDANALGVKVVGEGGNLGLTQQARIEFSRAGGRLNTDFIDNSAGVDCSDKEVNIKILLLDAAAGGSIKSAERDQLLVSMTEEVAAIVLEDNYLQTQAISIAEMQAIKSRESHVSLIRTLERDGKLDRAIEGLPDDEAFAEMAVQQKGLTRPELSTLLAYSKMSLKDSLLAGSLIESSYLYPELSRGFPKILRLRFDQELGRHQLRRGIVATTLANQVINRAGLTYIRDVREETGLSREQVVSAFLIVRDAFSLTDIWPAIDALDYKAPATIQGLMHMEICDFVKRQAIWFLNNAPAPLDIARLVEQYRPGLADLLNAPVSVLSPLERGSFDEKRAMYEEQKVPQTLARKVSALESMGPACDIVAVAGALKRPVREVGKAYFEIGCRIGLDWLRKAADMMTSEDHWDRLAARAVIDDLADQQRHVTRSILASSRAKSSDTVIGQWMKDQEEPLGRVNGLLADIRASGPVSVAKLSFATRHIRSILAKV